VLFTKKEETPPLLKSLSVQLQGRMLLGEARETAEKTVAEFGVTDFPKVVVLPSAPDAAPVPYEGELKPQALAAFLMTHAAEAPAAAEEAGAAGGDGGDAAAAEDLSLAVSASNVAELVEGEPLLFFHQLALHHGQHTAKPLQGEQGERDKQISFALWCATLWGRLHAGAVIHRVRPPATSITVPLM
jgi:hypothetical protein